MKKLYSVFVSHSRADTKLARNLVNQLRQHGIKVYFDEDITPGPNIYTELNRQLRKTDEVLVILSKESTKSANIMFELGAATSLGKSVSVVNVGKRKRLPQALVGNFLVYQGVGNYLSDIAHRSKEENQKKSRTPSKHVRVI